MKKLILSSIVSSIMLGSLTIAQAQEITAKEFSELSPKEAIELSHKWHQKDYASVAVTATEIQAIFPNNNRASIPLGEEFYISIAPYEKRTHECNFHVPTGCQGELASQKMHLKITDEDTGETIKDEVVNIQKDGFLDLWLPRDKKFVFVFEYKDKKAIEVLTSFKDSRTCITTMQLV